MTIKEIEKKVLEGARKFNLSDEATDLVMLASMYSNNKQFREALNNEVQKQLEVRQ